MKILFVNSIFAWGQFWELIIPKLFLFGPYIDGWHYFPVLFRLGVHFNGIESLFNGIEFHTIQYHWNHLTFQWYWQYWNSILLNCNLYFSCPHFIQKKSPRRVNKPHTHGQKSDALPTELLMLLINMINHMLN